MDNVQGRFLGLPHGTTPAAVTTNKNIKMSSFKSSENIQKKEGGPDRCFNIFWGRVRACVAQAQHSFHNFSVKSNRFWLQQGTQCSQYSATVIYSCAIYGIMEYMNCL